MKQKSTVELKEGKSAWKFNRFDGGLKLAMNLRDKGMLYYYDNMYIRIDSDIVLCDKFLNDTNVYKIILEDPHEYDYEEFTGNFFDIEEDFVNGNVMYIPIGKSYYEPITDIKDLMSVYCTSKLYIRTCTNTKELKGLGLDV